MAIMPTHTRYNDKDFEALRLRLFDLIRSVFPTWSDDATANFGNVLIESFAFIGDVMSYMMDMEGRESRFAFCQQRKNMQALCKLIGYELPGATAAIADVTLTVLNASALTGHVKETPIGSKVIVGTEDAINPVKGELQAGIDIDVGSGITTQIVPWKHSITRPRFTQASSGLPDQKVQVPFGPYLPASATVSTLTQGAFTEVDNFLLSVPSDKHFRIDVDHKDLATVYFGDGNNGVIPVGNINVDYQTGGGITGDVPEGTLKKIEGSFIDGTGKIAYLAATNVNSAAGGWPREEVDGARENAPESLKTLTRCVAREDFEIVAKKDARVGRALMLTSNEMPGIEENHGKLYVLPKAGGAAPSGLLTDVGTLCTVTYPHTVTFQLEVLSVVYHQINVEAWIWLKEGYGPTEVKAAIVAALEDFLEPMLASGAENPSCGFGYEYQDEDGVPTGEIPWSTFFDIVRDIAGVRKVGAGMTEFLLNGLHADLSIPMYKFPALGTVKIVNGSTGTEV